MKKILLAAVLLSAAAAFYLITTGPEQVTSPGKEKQAGAINSAEKNGKGSKGLRRTDSPLGKKTSSAKLSSDCLNREDADRCRKTKDGKKLTSPAPLSKKPGSLEEGSYSRLPE